eukprot:GFUD01096206.1.p1 GENE.GFUD01096206.1~~GFUD01096206.1.p1  ORF type:complete len:148 (-),score=30.93 GFUD01096206.1:28-429(-)
MCVILLLLLLTPTTISSSEPDLRQPEYYQVATDNPAILAVQGVFNKTLDTKNGYPEYKKFDGQEVVGTLFVNDHGNWQITASAHRISLRSKQTTDVQTLENMEWQKYRAGDWLDESSISVSAVDNQKNDEVKI